MRVDDFLCWKGDRGTVLMSPKSTVKKQENRPLVSSNIRNIDTIYNNLNPKMPYNNDKRKAKR
jgi:predicted AlkP superfamily phosphohydrolase/phosphomutase